MAHPVQPRWCDDLRTRRWPLSHRVPPGSACSEPRARHYTSVSARIPRSSCGRFVGDRSPGEKDAQEHVEIFSAACRRSRAERRVETTDSLHETSIDRKVRPCAEDAGPVREQCIVALTLVEVVDAWCERTRPRNAFIEVPLAYDQAPGFSRSDAETRSKRRASVS